MKKIAVNVGYVFNTFGPSDLIGIDLEKLDVLVSLHGDIFPLYRCKRFEDSRKIDDLLDRDGEFRVLDHIYVGELANIR